MMERESEREKEREREKKKRKKRLTHEISSHAVTSKQPHHERGRRRATDAAPKISQIGLFLLLIRARSTNLFLSSVSLAGVQNSLKARSVYSGHSSSSHFHHTLFLWLL
jgi:hypothetical protein